MPGRPWCVVRVLASSALRQHPVALFLSHTGSCCIALADLKLKVVLLPLPAAGDPPDPARSRSSPSFLSVFRRFHKFLALTLNSL